MKTRITLVIIGIAAVLLGVLALAGGAWWLLGNASCMETEFCRVRTEGLNDASPVKLASAAAGVFLFILMGVALVRQTVKMKKQD